MFQRVLRRGSCASAALLTLSLVAGCQQPLAVHDPYFRPGNTTAAAQRAETRHAIRYHRALQTARWSCPAPEAAASRRGGPAAARAALIALCADVHEPGTAAHGGTLNGYRRWVEDRVRRLPEATATGAGAAGS